MVTATGALSSTAAGAAAGSVVPGWGTAIGAGIGLLSSLLAPDGSSQVAGQARANVQNAQNQQQYQQALTAEALRRSVAGTTDAQGSTVRYDPATNSWVSALGKVPAQVQGSQNYADILRNSVDLPMATENNAASSLTASLARRNLSGANNALASYRDITPEAELGNLQQGSTLANAAVQNPLIADTLRQFARNGSSAGPVLGQIGRASSEALSKEMADNAVRAQTDAGNVNNARRQGLAGTVGAFAGQGTPSFSAPQSASARTAADLAASVNGREAGSASAASQGAYSSPFATHNVSGAVDTLGKLGTSTTGAQIAASARGVGDLVDNNTNLNDWISKQYSGSKLQDLFGGGTPANSTDPLAIDPGLRQRLMSQINDANFGDQP